jgi:hypothetical protein
MNAFKLYCSLTVIASIYFGHRLYMKEKEFFLWTIYLAKSKFYFCLALNCLIMILIVSGKYLINLFFGNVRLSELNVKNIYLYNNSLYMYI